MKISPLNIILNLLNFHIVYQKKDICYLIFLKNILWIEGLNTETFIFLRYITKDIFKWDLLAMWKSGKDDWNGLVALYPVSLSHSRARSRKLRNRVILYQKLHWNQSVVQMEFVRNHWRVSNLFQGGFMLVLFFEFYWGKYF